mgnify:FL=1
MLRIFNLFVLTILFSCSNTSSTRNRCSEEPDTLIGKPIHFPRTLMQVKNGGLVNADSAINIIEGSNYMVSIIDATCVKCIYYRLNILDSLFRTNLPPYVGKVFVINIEETAIPYFFSELYPAINAQGILLLDTAFAFERSNFILSSNNNHRTFMVDYHGKIALYGDPLHQPQYLGQYLNALNYR